LIYVFFIIWHAVCIYTWQDSQRVKTQKGGNKIMTTYSYYTITSGHYRILYTFEAENHYEALRYVANREECDIPRAAMNSASFPSDSFCVPVGRGVLSN
jgi:hypothetical protein